MGWSCYGWNQRYYESHHSECSPYSGYDGQQGEPRGGIVMVPIGVVLASQDGCHTADVEGNSDDDKYDEICGHDGSFR